MKMAGQLDRTTHASSMGDVSSLDRIPTEIWANILGFIPQEMPDVEEIFILQELPGIVEAPMKTSTYLTFRSTLFHLCLVSSRLDALARPLLFRAIVIWEPDSLLLLWRSLKCRPDLGHLVRELAVWMTLTRQSVVRNVVDAAKEKLESSQLSDDRDLYQTLIGYQDGHGGNHLDIPQRVVFNILCHAPHLSTFRLQVPRTAEDIKYTSLIRLMVSSCGLDVTSTQALTLGHDQPTVGQSLTTLQLCLDPCLPVTLRSRFDETQDMGFDHHDYWPLFGLSSLVQLYCWGDDASFALGFLPEEDGSTRPGSPPQGYLENIQEIRLDASSAGPKCLYSLCQNAPRLQSLRVSQRRHSQEQDLWYQPYSNSLDRGLLMRASTLQHLHLSFYDSWEYKQYVGPGQRLTCLPQLCHLETLQIQLQTLFGKMSSLSSVDIASILPRSLVWLTLEDFWEEDVIDTENRVKMLRGLIEPEEFRSGWIFRPGQSAGGFWGDYLKCIVKMLERLCEESAEKLPHLRRVHYVSDHMSTRRQGFGWNKAFDNIRAISSKKGIDFYVGEKTGLHR